jgi:UDP-N-acetylmuramyl pentapeptide phosphotransferase/UDP-N-acetylglucosamine-1-phosphate transferase
VALSTYLSANLFEETMLSSLLVMGFIIFSFGFMEDLTQKVSVPMRMWASLLPGFVGYYLTNTYLSSLDFAWLDGLLMVLPIGIFFTAFAISGMTHAMNFIDGLNGLSAWTATWILLGLFLLSMNSNLATVSVPVAILSGAIIGFLFWNCPLGKLFLGDGGAYFVGMAIAWFAISLSILAPEITAWSMLLLCAYPITETLFSMYRRFKSRQSSGQPDRAHLHQLIASCWIYPRFSSISLLMRNSLTGILTSLLAIPPLIAALVLYKDKWACIASYLLFATAYICLYQALIRRHQAQQIQLRQRKSEGGVRAKHP